MMPAGGSNSENRAGHRDSLLMNLNQCVMKCEAFSQFRFLFVYLFIHFGCFAE